MKVITSKKQKEVCQRIVANAIIAYDLLDVDKLPADKLIRYTKCIIENTVEAVGAIGGIPAMLAARDTMARYQKRYEGGSEK